MKPFEERLNGLRWRLQAMKRLWSPGADPGTTFLPPPEPEPGPVGRVDDPAAGTELGPETVTIKGWATFDEGATGSVEAWLDDAPLGRARLGLPRADVEAVNHRPYAAVSGFDLSVDFSRFDAGESSLRLRATGTDDSVLELDPVPITVTATAGEEPKPSSPPAPLPLPPDRSGQGMRTLVVTHQLNLGGAQLYLLDLLRGLTERGGFELTVIGAMDGAVREDLEEMGIPVHLTSFSAHDDLGSHLGWIEELTAWMAPREFELAFVNTATAPACAIAEAAVGLGIPAVWGIHESLEPAELWASVDPEVRACAEATLSKAAFAVFEAVATLRIYEPLVGAERCRMLPYGLDMAPIEAGRGDFDAAAARRAAGLPLDAKVVVCVGTVEPRKAQVPLAQAFGEIAARYPDAHLVFVGARPGDHFTEALESCVASSPGRDRTRLIPVTPEVDSWYGMADLLVCASDVESLPRTVLEAMAWGTPVLATDVFGLPELITDGETGWLCEPRDIKSLADGLERALSATPEEYSAIARAARALVEERHSLKRYGAEIAELLSASAENSLGSAPGHAETP